MQIQKEKILVTGGAGFIGSHLVDRLVAEGYPVAVVDNLSSGSPLNLNPAILSHTNGCSLYRMDVRDSELHRVFQIERPTYVYHLAGHIDLRFSVEDPLHDIDINIAGGINLLKNALRESVKKVVFASSGGAIYGDLPENLEAFPHNHPPSPASPYGYSKLMFEKYLEFAHDAYNLNSVSLRFSNVYGPRQELSKESGVIAIFTSALFNERPLVIYGDGNQTRDFMYVDDCVDMLMRSLSIHIHGVFNVSTGKKTSVHRVTEILSSSSNIPFEIVHDKDKKGDVKNSCLSYSVTKEVTGWEPKTDIEEGIRKTLAWTKKQKETPPDESSSIDLYQSIFGRRTRHWFHGSLWR
ncbi:NAD-dependent epimerase/dehydratase family protein [Candidatus Uhrbacteria bacterium]|nr:NAD-dependent epimerase/dehydratase family protein [Candidatus Uhrbacteria bacterium]